MTTVPTPPLTTLSTPSPTEQSSERNPQDSDSMPSPATKSRPIYLIVATAVSRNLGIGNKGTLPWPQIKADMAFFRKVTSSSPSSVSTSRTQSNDGTTTTSKVASTAQNAVIMGRKTWDSIPERYRPLASRLNVILTRADRQGCLSLAERIAAEIQRGSKENSTVTVKKDEDVNDNGDGNIVSIIKEDNEGGRQRLVVVTNSLRTATNISTSDKRSGSGGDDVQRVFCIGGAEVYGMMLNDKELRNRVRVLQTLVKRLDGSAIECDTYWPEKMEEGENGWTHADESEILSWIGVELPQQQEDWLRDEKAGVEIRVVGWSRQA